MTTYPFVPSYWDDYGTRDQTLGLMLHMAEGSGTVGYLDKNFPPGGRPPPRGVSVHFVCELDGTLVQMLQLNQASGSLNPNDRSTDKAYYGHSHLVDVLGDWWPNPNEAVISIEIEGFAATGPNVKQRSALTLWAADMVRRFPTIRGALGHADQTNTKGCPGTTAAMKAVFASIGGHGLWPKEVPNVPGLTITDLVAAPGTVTVKNIAGVQAVQVDDPSQRFAMAPGSVKTTVAKGRLVGDPLGADTPGNDRHTVRLIGDELAVLLDGQVDYVATDVDCADKVAAEHERTRQADIAALEALP